LKLHATGSISDNALLALHSLTSLDLGLNKRITNDSQVATMTSLVELNLSGNCVVTDAGISGLTSLTTLVLMLKFSGAMARCVNLSLNFVNS
jgi:Leucine-rich repeat (LRR) protein